MPTVFHSTVYYCYYYHLYFIIVATICYCHHYKTVATDKPLRASLFPGAAKLTTHLLRLINILWLPLCQINKFGFYFPRRLLQSPILVGHQDYFLAPLPGSIALFVSSFGIHIVRCNPFIMDKPCDGKVPILPSTTRRGTTLNTSIALDSPSVMSKLLTPSMHMLLLLLSLKMLLIVLMMLLLCLMRVVL
jgi:hypothetical protein